jgi:hypothetical protein
VFVVDTSQTPTRARNIIDMSDPATAYSRFGAMHVVLLPCPILVADCDEYRLVGQVMCAGIARMLYGGI